jgi:transmembrane sensor
MKPSRPTFPPATADAVATTAAEWVMRQDRGLSPGEQDRFLQWLAADPRHAEAITRQRRAWEVFDRLAGLQSSVSAMPDPDLLAPETRPAESRMWRWAARVVVPMAAAVAIAFVLWSFSRTPADMRSPAISGPGAIVHVAPIEERVLDDGSVIQLNRGARVVVDFSTQERRVRLERGEAAFNVTKDAARPFVVATASVTVRAVGTAFNVRLADRAIEVIVTEGSVAVADGGAAAEATLPAVVAGQRAVVSLATDGGAPTVGTLPADELARRLAWQPRMLNFTDEPLTTILDEFNRHNSIALRVDEPALRELRLTARLRSDNVDGFLRILASDYAVSAQYGPLATTTRGADEGAAGTGNPDGVIVLRQAR